MIGACKASHVRMYFFQLLGEKIKTNCCGQCEINRNQIFHCVQWKDEKLWTQISKSMQEKGLKLENVQTLDQVIKRSLGFLSLEIPKT